MANEPLNTTNLAANAISNVLTWEDTIKNLTVKTIEKQDVPASIVKGLPTAKQIIKEINKLTPTGIGCLNYKHLFDVVSNFKGRILIDRPYIYTC